MTYGGSYELFDISRVKTYPLARRHSRESLQGLINPSKLAAQAFHTPSQPWYINGAPGDGPASKGLEELAGYVVECRKKGRPVILFTGAHPVKNGLHPLFIDLIERGLVTLFSTNCASVIHSFEFALTGASSESVSDALPKGEFGMAFETGAYLNYAIICGVERGYGLGESMGRLFCDTDFRRSVIDRTFENHADTGEYFKPYEGFPYEDSCVVARAYRKGIPVCVHVSLGTDIIDQHASSDPAAKGRASGTDFLIFTEEMAGMTEGGVILNIGTAIMGPEVMLKAASMVTNVGRKPKDLWTGDFDIRPFGSDSSVGDESRHYYYLRDQKTVATRIPKAFQGRGYYFQGRHEETLTAFYQRLVSKS